MDGTTAVGFLAGTLTTIAFLPQVIRAWRSHSTHDLSPVMLIVFLTGIVLWTFYGMEIGSFPMIISNAATIGLVGILLALKVKYG
ncbi:MAG: SemiSWEET transporter [Methanomicrobiales archaeon]|nr:SemiSWEET transporter [Methanomicrobiales archaeon]